MANYITNRLTIIGPNIDEFLADNKKEIHFSQEKFVKLNDLSIHMDTFDTRYVPPYQLLKKLGVQFPKLTFCLSFYGEDVEHGRILIQNGIWIDKESYVKHAGGSSFEEMVTIRNKEYMTHKEWVGFIFTSLSAQKQMTPTQVNEHEAWDEAMSSDE